MIDICFRFDDPSEVSDYQLEVRILSLFAKYQTPVCLAVVPFKVKEGTAFPLSEGRVRDMQKGVDSGIVEIAQHGHSHVNEKRMVGMTASEFAGVGFREQREKICEGRRHLSSLFGSPIEGFVPPYNTYDSVTMDVLKDNEFQYISAGWESPDSWVRQNAVTILPRTCTLRNVGKALDEGLRYRKLRPAVVVVLHHDDFKEYEHADDSDDHPPFTSLDELEQLLSFIKDNPGMNGVSISFLSKRFGTRGKPARHIAFWRWQKGLYWRFRREMPEHLLIAEPKYKVVLESIKRASFGKWTRRGMQR